MNYVERNQDWETRSGIKTGKWNNDKGKSINKKEIKGKERESMTQEQNKIKNG